MNYLELREILNLLVPISRDAHVFASGVDAFFKEPANNPNYENTRRELLVLSEVITSSLNKVTEVVKTINVAQPRKAAPAKVEEVSPKKVTKK